ncbi:MAG: hypothetical protein HRT66_11745 [Flavobacteriaceae bacterium]|nr:hypothetical protein [Flavobacteriaceae bacterium]
MSGEAIVNVVKHYDSQLDSGSKKDGVVISSAKLSNDKGIPDKKILIDIINREGSGFLSFFKSNVKNDIKVNTLRGTVHSKLNTASNIKNTLVHEYQHQKDGSNPTETNAIKTQRAHSSYETTTKSYKNQ